MRIATFALATLSLVLSHSAVAIDTVSNEGVETMNKAPRTQTINFDEVPLTFPPPSYTRHRGTGVRFDNTEQMDGLTFMDFYNSAGIPIDPETTGFSKGASSAPYFATAFPTEPPIYAVCRSGFLRLKSVNVMPVAKWDFSLPPPNPPSVVDPPPSTVLITGYNKGGDAIAQKRVLLDISKMNGPKRVKFGKKIRKVRKVSFEHEQASVARTRRTSFDYYFNGGDTPTIDNDSGPPMSLFFMFAIDDLKVKVSKAFK